MNWRSPALKPQSGLRLWNSIALTVIGCPSMLRRSDPRTVDTLLRISERVAKLHGLDAPQRIEASGPNGGPIQTEETKPDFDKLSHDELLIFMALHQKAAGDPNWEEHIRYFGTEMGERTHPGRLIVAFVKAMPFGDEPWKLAQGATALPAGN